MTKNLVFSAKSVEEALSLAAQELKVEESEIRYEILEQPKKGFLGLGSSEAKISVTYQPTLRQVTEDFLQTFLNNVGIPATLSCEEKADGELAYSISGDDLGVLIGHHGEALDSLQYLLSLVTNRHGEEFVRVTVDIENYRSKREDTLRALARKTASRVKKTGRNVTFEPMSAYERRIIHSQAQEIEGVTTHSIGSGDDRRVVMSSTDPAPRHDRAPRPKREEKSAEDKPKVTYEYNPVREPRKIVKAKSIDEINLADVEDTEMVNL